MTTIERVGSQTGQEDQIAVTIVDTDVHPVPVSGQVLKDYAPAEWVDKIWPTGNAANPVSYFYDTPDSYKTSSVRMDSMPPKGGFAGSDPDFAAKQLLFTGSGGPPPRYSVINRDDEWARKLQTGTSEVLWRNASELYGLVPTGLAAKETLK